LPSRLQRTSPVALLARFDEVVAFDHARQRLVVVANEIEGEITAEQAEARLDELVAVLTAPAPTWALALPAPPLSHAEPVKPVADDFDGPAFELAVERAKEHIRAGDIFQVVLARRFGVETTSSPLAIYRALRLINPSPYMVLLELPSMALVGASPEMLVRVTGRRAETRPIAGTRPRGRDAEADAALAAELLADPKERAEHVMLVDLGRNDLGRIGAGGSVRVDDFMVVERYSHVMHIVSGVTAQLAEGRSALDALLACFPAGTVSGAPKVRAMEIIEALEPSARGAYAGAIGYLGFGGDLDTCITIRTLVIEGGRASVTAGAGIVADSDPTREREETENKAAGTLAAVRLAAELEGLR
jgi:anthranilate synthase component 1